MAASGDVSPQTVVAFDIGLGLTAQGQGLRGIERRPADDLAIDQPVQEVQHMGLGRNALGQSQLHRSQHGLFFVLKNRARISTISRSPPGLRSICSCSCRKAGGNSAKGAPLRNAPGLRWRTAR